MLLNPGAALHGSGPSPPTDLSRMGVFIGISWTEYAQLTRNHSPAAGSYTAQGAVLSVAPGRLSYHFGFKGPAIACGALALFS